MPRNVPKQLCQRRLSVGILGMTNAEYTLVFGLDPKTDARVAARIRQRASVIAMLLSHVGFSAFSRGFARKARRNSACVKTSQQKSGRKYGGKQLVRRFQCDLSRFGLIKFIGAGFILSGLGLASHMRFDWIA